jgi:hypothetical protein
MRRLPLALALSACQDAVVVDVDVEHASEGPLQTLVCVERRKVDVLLIVEDSPAMAEEQSLLPEVGHVLAKYLECFHDTDWRVAVTTANVAGPHCPAAGDGGRFITAPCRARLDEFVDAARDYDARPLCLEACPYDALDTLPTELAGSAGPAPRPWLESVSGVTNLDPGVDVDAGLPCLALQGVDGCTFAAPLEAMARALTAALDPSAPEFGFLREDAQLVVAFVSATPDCSVNPEFAEIFAPDGDRRFWSDPSRATPGVCWNAGVRCVGDGPDLSSCAPESWNMSGSPGAPPADAVLTPVARYVDMLRDLVTSGHTTGVAVTVLGGVPLDYQDGAAEIEYSRACAPGLVAELGICPGCGEDSRAGAPPVRLQALVDAFLGGADRRMASICASWPGGLWEPLTQKLNCPYCPDPLGCLDTCAADTDPSTPTVEPRCEVAEVLADGTKRIFPACELGEVDGRPEYVLPSGADACHIIRGDDPRPECFEHGSNVDVALLSWDQPPDGACVTIQCTPSRDPARDCPYLETHVQN